MDSLLKSNLKRVEKVEGDQIEQVLQSGEMTPNQVIAKLVLDSNERRSQIAQAEQQKSFNPLKLLGNLVQGIADIIPTSPSAKLANLKLSGGGTDSLGERKFDLAERRLTFEKQEEERRIQGENRRQVDQVANNVDSFGRALDTENPTDIAAVESLGLDLDNLQALGKASRKSNGRIFIKSKKARDRIEEQKSIPQTVQKAFAEFKDTRDIITDSVKTFKEIGLELSVEDKNLVQQLFSPAGVLSVSAKSNVLRQFQNPKTAALFDKLERAFSKVSY